MNLRHRIVALAGNPLVSQWILVAGQDVDHFAGTVFVWRPEEIPPAEVVALKAEYLDAALEETYGHTSADRFWNIYQGPTEPIEDVWPT